jgi:SET domain-containing protein
VRATPAGRSLIARQAIAPGTRLFGEDDWADEAERASFTTLSQTELQALTPERRAAFLRYGYNTAPDEITGSFNPEAVRHPTNFLNHSCDPNAGYDGTDAIVSLRPIAAGEEIRMDYGTFSFSFDHEFSCRCGAPSCRGRVTARDWPDLVRAGLRLPAFMRARVP